MKLKVLTRSRYIVAAVMDGDECPAEVFITEGEASTSANREGLWSLLERVAMHGLESLPSSLFHEADKQRKVYEFVKGRLRLFCFKGSEDIVVICVDGTLKDSKKANPRKVSQASVYREEFFVAVEGNTLTLVEDDENE